MRSSHVSLVNTAGAVRLTKFYSPVPHSVRTSLPKAIFKLVSNRPSGLCNFLDAPDLPLDWAKNDIEDDEIRVVYRCYATLYFVFVVDSGESELGVLDLIQVSQGDRPDWSLFAECPQLLFGHSVANCTATADGLPPRFVPCYQVLVESLDRAFESVCELDLVFHFDEVHYILAEVIQGGLVLETNVDEIASAVRDSNRARKASYTATNPLSLGVGSVGTSGISVGALTKGMGFGWLTGGRR
ncbi:Sigma-adaptin 3A [Tulasnella sp. JGI-2019a]|nr:Sigma-adaptin 3A [Tulasnella sp. JGI-2019a]